MNNKKYLGDGVYAEWDGWMIRLSTERFLGGQQVTHEIFLEPEIVAMLEHFIATIRSAENNP
jgi:hypothetical protein